MKKAKPLKFPDYETPPVIEVVCGIVFERIRSFKANHVGLFWEKVRVEFPGCEHASRLGFNPEIEPFDLANYLPRVWFISQKQNRLIQLQDDRFFFNWRKIEDDETYPRYSTIIEAFKTNLGALQEFLQEEDLGSLSPESCELTYINHIPKGKGWESLSDLNRVFRDFAWESTRNRFLPEPVKLAGRISFRLPKDYGFLDLSLQQRKRRPDKWPVLILHNSATGLGSDKSMEAVWKWFQVAHEWIVRGFADLTGMTIQKDVWRRIDKK